MDNQNYQPVPPQQVQWQQPAPEPPKKKPLYKRWWMWVIAILVIFIFIIPKGGDDPTPTSTPAPVVTVTQTPTVSPSPTQTTVSAEPVKEVEPEPTKTYAKFDTSSVAGMKTWFESAYEGSCDVYLDGDDLRVNMEGVFTMGGCNDIDDGSITMFVVLDPGMSSLREEFWSGFDQEGMGMPYTRGDTWVVASDKDFLVESLASGQGTKTYHNN